MARNQAIVVGINQYEFLQPLRYAKQDALAMREFLCNQAGFDRVFLFADGSEEIAGKSTRPFRANLLRVLREMFASPFLGDGDNFWFFFSGHGMRHQERDYLMPQDGDPHDIENTGISINSVTENLRRCGADNVVLILDACRNLATRSGEGIGNQTAERVRQTGVISIFSCSPAQFSYEIEALQQGAFTKALLEGLGMQGRCATVERLNQFLEHRVPELVAQHYRAPQTPYTIAEPVTKSHLILIPQHATVQDKATLKLDAYRAEAEQDYRLAEQCWLRVLAVPPPDPDAISAIKRLARMKMPSPVTPSTPPTIDESTNDDIQSRAVQWQHEIEMLQQQLELKRMNADSLKARQEYEFESQLIDANLQGYMDVMRGKQSSSKRQKDNLSSERFGANYYAMLRDLLKASNWEDADRETADRMLEVMDRQQEGWLRVEDAEKFPCQDLRTIDQLWVKYSDGKFGFSIQKKVWQECGSPMTYDKDWEKFGDCVGWRINGGWRILNNLNPSPCGVLPYGVFGRVGFWWRTLNIGARRRGVRIGGFFSRITACDL